MERRLWRFWRVVLISWQRWRPLIGPSCPLTSALIVILLHLKISIHMYNQDSINLTALFYLSIPGKWIQMLFYKCQVEKILLITTGGAWRILSTKSSVRLLEGNVAHHFILRWKIENHVLWAAFERTVTNIRLHMDINIRLPLLDKGQY